MEEKANEIVAIPLLLEALDLSECIVTIDAMGCQTDIAEKIIEAKADYILALKRNQENLFNKVESWFDDLDKKTNRCNQALLFQPIREICNRRECSWQK